MAAHQSHIKGLDSWQWEHQDPLSLHKGLEAIATSLSLLSDSLGTAMEESLRLVEMKKKQQLAMKEELENTSSSSSPSALLEEKPQQQQQQQQQQSQQQKNTPMKASHDVAIAMASKAKLLLRELRRVKAELEYSKERCAQLDAENKRLRENANKDHDDTHEEDDLVRLQLETLLAEKARLTQENAAYARENQFLHEVVQYHQLTLQNVVLDEGLFEDALDPIIDHGPIDVELSI